MTVQGYFVTGTDTEVGKTVASAWMMLHLNGCYWKPLQTGSSIDSDTKTVQILTQFPEERFFPPTHELKEPLSPHEAARREAVRIDLDQIHLPQSEHTLIVEGAGGVMVPLNENTLIIDLIKKLQLPVVLVCRSQLGTINHTLLSLEAMKSREIPVNGIIINGSKSPHNRQALEEFGRVPVIAEIEDMENLTRESLLSIQPEAVIK